MVSSFAKYDQKRLSSDAAKERLLKNTQMHSLNLLSFIVLVVFDIEIVIENAKIATLEQLELQLFCHPT